MTSDVRPQDRDRADRRPLIAGVAGVALVLVGLALFGPVRGWLGLGPDAGRFGEIAATFEGGRDAFVAADEQMRALVMTNPGAERIVWHPDRICVRIGPAEPDDCTPVDREHRAAFTLLPGAGAVVYQAKDDGRTFFRLAPLEDASYTIMHAPVDSHPHEFASARGFRASRSLGGDWTVLGPITDDSRNTAQWP